ncbi:unnamed protein product [Sphagnum jensenii]
MANTDLIQSLVAAESLRVLSNELVLTNKVNRAYEDKYDLFVEDHRIGTTINIPLPMRNTIRTGWTMSTQNVTETSIPLTINTIRGVDLTFSESELALLVPDPNKNMEAWSKRFLKPRITRLANEIDRLNFAAAYVQVANQVGTAGTVPQTWSVIGDAMQKLNENLAPQADRIVIMNPAMQNKMSDALKGTYVREVSESALVSGFIGELANMEFFMSQNVPVQTVGAQGGTPVVNGASQIGSSIITNGWTASTQVLNAGDIITFAGSYGVNYVTQTPTTNLQQFVVTANVTSDGSGNATIPISTGIGAYNGIITSGPTQNVSASPTNGGAITVTGSAATGYAQNIAFHKDAFTVAFARLSVPKEQGVKVAQASYDGFTMRYMRAYDIVNAQQLDRLDAYWGFAGLYTQHAVRITA